MKERGLSVIILTHNEKDKISKTLNSVKDIADQIILVDDYSDPAFIRMCKKIVPHVEIYRRKLVDFAEQKNFGIEKAKYEWILNLDADEEITPELSHEISDIVKKGSEFDAFRIKFITFLFDRFLEANEMHIRFFRNGDTKFINSVHEILDVKGRIGTLNGKIIHDHWKGYKDWFEKLNKYAYAAAIRDIRNGKNYSKFGIIIRMLMFPIINLFEGLILRGRYKLGIDGIIHACVGSTNAIRRFAVYYEIKYKRPEIFRKEFRSCKK